MIGEATSGGPSDGAGRTVPDGVTAVVVTHMRPVLAGDVIRSLIDVEGVRPGQIVVVVNGVGGLDDPLLEEKVRMVRLDTNTGPAGGFRAGMVEAFSDPATRWAYLCEDDIGLFSLPQPRLAGLVHRIEALGARQPPIGAAVAYGRTFVGRGPHTVNLVPPTTSSDGFTPVDVACWGATLVSRAVVDAGVYPDPEWFFGLEDFDFFCRVREAGLGVVMDDGAARQVAADQTTAGRQAALRHRRPDDGAEAWRDYYHARNSFALIRRHGRPHWYAWHLAFSARRLQKAGGAAERSAIAHGLWDGARGRMGENSRYGRRVGEFGSGATRAEVADQPDADGPEPAG
jgi:GT2 family glycosyltransferase